MEIVRYSSKLTEEHCVFAERMWPKKRRRRMCEYIRWKFRAEADDDTQGFLVAVDGGKVVGQLGLIPVRAICDGVEIDAQWACDLIVAPESRGKGIALQLFRHGMMMKPLTLGSNPSPSAQPLMVKLGFKLLYGPYQMVLSRPRADMEAIFGQGHFLRAYPLMRSVSKLVSNQRTPTNCSDEKSFVKDINVKELLRDHRTTSEGVRFGIVHDEQFLTWRCNGLRGYDKPLSIWRSSSNAHVMVNKASDSWYVADWKYSTNAEGKNVMRCALASAMRENVRMIYAYANGEKELASFVRLGFVPMLRPVRVLCYADKRANIKLRGRFTYTGLDSDDRL